MHQMNCQWKKHMPRLILWLIWQKFGKTFNFFWVSSIGIEFSYVFSQ
ncbi:unnamed protein product [Arabidopsis halleri]